jgi:putative ABC transport system permease protein
MLLRRLRSERGIIVLIVALVTATSFVFAAAPRLFNRVSNDALHYAAQAATPAQRDISLNLVDTISPGAGGVEGVRALGEQYAAEFPPSVAALIDERILQITSVRMAVTAPPSYTTYVSLRYQDGLPEATRLSSGRWPVDLGVPLELVGVRRGGPGPTDRPPPEPVVLEVALSIASAAEIGVHVGDRYGVTLDESDPLNRGFRLELTPTEIEVVGLYEPLDPTATYWDPSDGLLLVSQHGTPDNPVAYATAYVPAETYPSLWANRALLFHYDWRYRIDLGSVDAGDVAQLQYDVQRLSRITGTTGSSSSPGTVVVLTSLPAILDRYAAQRALSESILSIAVIGPFGLASGAMAMVAFLLVSRRRAMLALARGRGASGSLVLGTQLWEAVLLAGGAAVVGLLFATAIVDAKSSPLSAILAIAVAAAATLLLVGASWSVARRPLGQLERDDPPVLGVAPRRLVIEATIVFVTVAAALLLRQRGLTLDEAGGLARVDPLLASVPLLSGLAAGIVAMRLYPLPIRALGWLAARRRDVVPVLGLRTIGRHPAAANLPVLVLLLTAAFGTFSSVIASSLEHGQVAASYLAVGADFRVEKFGIGALGGTLDAAAVPGVEAVAPGIVDTSADFTSGPNRRAFIHLAAIEPLAYEAVTAGSPAEPRWPGAFLAEPAGTGVGTVDNPIPAILSIRLPAGSAGLAPGNTFSATVTGRSLTFQLVEQRERFPGIDAGASFVVVPLNWVRAAFENPNKPPSVLWVRGPAGVGARLAATIAEVRESAHVVSRYDAYAKIHDAPFGAFIATAYGLALAVAATYMALAIVGALILSGVRRTRDLAYLRTLGVTPRQALALTVMEHAPPVVLALVPGVALGIGIALLCEPGLGLASFVGTSGVPLFLDWGALAVMVAALIGVVAAAVAAGTWLSRRARLVDVLRIGED